MTGLKESIWTLLAHWGDGVMLRREAESHVDAYIQKFKEHMNKIRAEKAPDSYDTYEMGKRAGFDLAKSEAVKFLEGPKAIQEAFNCP